MARDCHGKCGAFADGTLYIDFSPMILDDAITDGESQPGSLANVLGGKKRFEYSRQDLGRNSSAGVRD